MIIIENTNGKTRAEVRSSLFVAASFAAARNPKIWLHVEKQGREVAVNTDDDPIRPGVLAYGDDSYLDSGIDYGDGGDFAQSLLNACDELGL